MIHRMVEEEAEEGDRLALWEKARLIEEEEKGAKLLEEEEDARLGENRVERTGSSEGKIQIQTVDPSKAAEVSFILESHAQSPHYCLPNNHHHHHLH